MRKFIYKVINPSDPIPSGHVRVKITDELAEEMNKNHEDTLNMIRELTTLLENNNAFE